MIPRRELFENTEENRQKVRDALILDDVQIVFTKANGEERVMACTLRPAAINYEKSSGPRKVPDTDESQAVWDIEANWWRSFRWDSLICWQVLVH